ncbi:hypothetical protein D3C76_840130 [compost metagenome]
MSRQDQGVRVFRQFDSIQHQLKQVAEITGIAHQHRPQEGFVVLADNQTFVDFFVFVEVYVAATAWGATVRIADAANIHAEQFQLGAHVRAGEGIFVTEDVVHGDLRHFISRCYKAVHAVAPAGAFADGVDVRVGGLARIINHDPAALRYGQTALGRHFVARADTGGEDDEVHFQLAAVGEAHGFTRVGAFLNDLFGIFAGVNFHTHALDLAFELIATHVVELLCHQHRGKFDDVGFDT